MNSWESNQVAIEPDCKSILVAHLELILHKKRLTNPIVSYVDSDGLWLASSKAMKRAAITGCGHVNEQLLRSNCVGCRFHEMGPQTPLEEDRWSPPTIYCHGLDCRAALAERQEISRAGTAGHRKASSHMPYLTKHAASLSEMIFGSAGAILFAIANPLSGGDYFEECRNHCSEVKRRVVSTQGTDGLLAHCPLQYGVRLSKNAEIPSCAS